MNFECDTKNGMRIIRITRDIGIKDDIRELVEVVKEALQEGIKKIALSFTPDSYLSTRSISVLVQCFEAVDEEGGRFMIIAPNEDILSVLRTIGCSIGVYKSESEIA